MALLVIAGIHPAIGTGVGACVGAATNYYLQRRITFGSTNPYLSELARYLKAVIKIWVANLVVFIFLHTSLHFSTLLAQVVTTVAVAVMSYFLYQRGVFNEQRS